jgi:hypothetical protein
VTGTFPDEGGPYDTGYTPYRKPAEQVLRFYYLRSRIHLPVVSIGR